MNKMVEILIIHTYVCMIKTWWWTKFCTLDRSLLLLFAVSIWGRPSQSGDSRYAYFLLHQISITQVLLKIGSPHSLWSTSSSFCIGLNFNYLTNYSKFDYMIILSSHDLPIPKSGLFQILVNGNYFKTVPDVFFAILSSLATLADHLSIFISLTWIFCTSSFFTMSKHYLPLK